MSDEISYRFVRFKINGNEEYETIITNLPNDEFNSEEIKDSYGIRWGIETSYRHLKYSVDLSAYHSKNTDWIKQEIIARMIMYNLSMIIIDEASNLKILKNTNKLKYEINVGRAIHLIMGLAIKRKGGIPPNLLELIAKEVLSVRKNRHYKRKDCPHPFVNFGYRL